MFEQATRRIRPTIVIRMKIGREYRRRRLSRPLTPGCRLSDGRSSRCSAVVAVLSMYW